MTEYVRTAIRRLSIRGFRSIRSVDLEDVPDLVVLHGPNGAGKSNLLLAAQLVLRAATRPGELPVGRDSAVGLSLSEGDKSLGLRPDDFHYGQLPEIRVAIDVVLGTKAAEIVRAPVEHSLGRLSMEVVVQLPADDEIRFWFERADLDGTTSLGPITDAGKQELRRALSSTRNYIDGLTTQLAEEEAQLALIDSQPASQEVDAQRTQILPRLLGDRKALRTSKNELHQIEAQLDKEALLAERIRTTLLRRPIQVSPAYRVPGGPYDPEEALYHKCLSDNRLERDAMRRLGQRLASVGLFGTGAEQVAIVPVDDKRYGERRIFLSHPTHGDLPLRNLGSGEQQIVYMLAQSAMTPFPIAQIEEPEAHLHTSLMARLAHILHQSVTGDGGAPDVDQLWIATHHHHFAISPDYFDVKLDGGATTVTRKPRAKAAPHFYEPGPIWEALRQLATSAKTRSDIVFRNAEGAPVSAAEILESIESDPEQRVAKDYAREMTEAMVLAMRQRAETQK
jgi:hypothetical protein